MQLHELYISTKPPTESKHPWVTQGLNQYHCCFIGYLSNAQAIREQLSSDNKTADHHQNIEQLIDAAIQRWGHSVNQHLQGDYVLAWSDELQQHLHITASARSSFSLFYTVQHQANDNISIASDIKKLHKSSNALNPSHWLQQLSLGPLIGEQTFLHHIRRLQPGETIAWDMNDYQCTHQVKLQGEQQLTLANNALSERYAHAQPLIFDATANDLNDQPNALQLFNRLPQIAHHLAEPINDALLAHFDLQISQCEDTIITLDESWFTGRLDINQRPFNKQTFDSKITWQKSIIRDSLLKKRHQISRHQDDLYAEFQNDSHHLSAIEPLSFSQWLDLHFVIPAWGQLYQRIANGYGKTLINPFMQSNHALAMINKASVQQQRTQQSQGFFSIEDNSMCNIYDAMQRLFRSGEKATKQWFQLAPTATARFIKQNSKHSSPQISRLGLHRPVEQTCIAMLTFDYLTKFHHHHVDTEINI